jgi:hypothetical protein
MPPPPSPPPYQPMPQSVIPEAHLEAHLPLNPQPLSKPNTRYPGNYLEKKWALQNTQMINPILLIRYPRQI